MKGLRSGVFWRHCINEDSFACGKFLPVLSYTGKVHELLPSTAPWTQAGESSSMGATWELIIPSQRSAHLSPGLPPQNIPPDPALVPPGDTQVGSLS